MNKETFKNYIEVFLEENSKLNLISKNDEKFLWEKHICDSLAIEKFFEKYNITNLSGKKLLDVGTGGGFPSVPIAIQYPELEVFALDSIHKKINAILEIKNLLHIKNLNTICNRAENIAPNKFDFITSRAVAALKILVPYAIPLLDQNGYFIAYKSLKVQEEISDAKPVLKKFNAEVSDLIEYNVPLTVNHTRNLVVIKKI